MAYVPDPNDVSTMLNSALLQHFDYMFKEVKHEERLHVIVLEHAYFTGDKRHKHAVRRVRRFSTRRTPNRGIPSCVAPEY